MLQEEKGPGICKEETIRNGKGIVKVVVDGKVESVARGWGRNICVSGFSSGHIDNI